MYFLVEGFSWKHHIMVGMKNENISTQDNLKPLIVGVLKLRHVHRKIDKEFK